uniref:Hydroxyproline-rich glycoprotein n=1 Tax=Rhizophora mucronata TaxID=61149 RepID=A0A2P2IV00_RHIMU
MLFVYGLLKQDAITNVKQQCSDFSMTRNIQCREMIEDVQRTMAGLSFQDQKNAGSYNYPAVQQPHQTQRAASQPPPEPQNVPISRPQRPYYQPPDQPTIMSGYAQHIPPYPPYQAPPGVGVPYPAPQVQQQPPTSREYGQPAYPGWRGPYYNAHAPHGQQPGSFPRPPYTAPYPPHQGGYYKQ